MKRFLENLCDIRMLFILMGAALVSVYIIGQMVKMMDIQSSYNSADVKTTAVITEIEPVKYSRGDMKNDYKITYAYTNGEQEYTNQYITDKQDLVIGDEFNIAYNSEKVNHPITWFEKEQAYDVISNLGFMTVLIFVIMMFCVVYWNAKILKTII